MISENDNEQLNRTLNDPLVLAEYKAPYDDYKPKRFPRLLGYILIKSGDLLYGTKPSYLKFRALEIVARTPYHSWESAIYTLLTLFFSNPKRAMSLAKVAHFSRLAQDNETMHVIVISELSKRKVKAGFIHYTLIPMIFAFGYFWGLYLLYLISKKQSLELNYIFENHAFHQYDEFLRTHEQELRNSDVNSEFLLWYGRDIRTEYEFFRSIRNDELIHRNMSIKEIQNT